jgi:DNA-binding MarR family transcriptional regulator
VTNINVHIKELDQVVFHPKRLLIMSFLIAIGPLAQGDLKKKCELTWGELTAHLKQLEKAKYIGQRHIPTLKGPRAVVNVTETGNDIYNLTLNKLKEFLTIDKRELTN